MCNSELLSKICVIKLKKEEISLSFKGKIKMDLKFLKWHLIRGFLMKRVVLRAFMLVLAMIVVSLMQMAREVRVIDPIMFNNDECPLNLDSNPDFNLTGFFKSASRFAFPRLEDSFHVSCKDNENLTKIVFKELIEKNLLQSKAKTLCVGDGSASAVLALRHLGFFDAFGVERHPFFSLFKRGFVYELDFEDNHFDFVFSRNLDRVLVPSLLVSEMERVLRPGGTGVMLVGGRQLYSGDLVGPATPFASFLKCSDVIHVCRVGPFTLVIFKKRLENFASFERFRLPTLCPSVDTNKPFMNHLEPLADKNPSRFDLEKLSYLPKFMNISSRNKMVYINVGAGEFAKMSVTKMSKPYCSDHHSGFEVYVIEHKTNVLTSYVTDPGINFIYHPALAGEKSGQEISSDEYFSAPLDEEGFDFVRWFNETVSNDDFVVLMMNSNLVEMKILVELFETGAICHVDELFLRCSDGAYCKNVLTSLRKSGVYVHQWSGD